MLKLNILLLCNKPDIGVDANTIIDHISAVENYSQHNIFTCSNLGDLPRKLDLGRFDGIIIHYSICLLHDCYLSSAAKKHIRNFKGLKIVFIQDEYRQINKIVQELKYLDINILYTCFPESEIENIYPEKKLPGVKKYNNLTGYMPEKLLSYNHSLIENRPIDVGYRARKVPFWLGELAFEKWDIVERWKKNVADKSITVDISYREKDRFYGAKWLEFLSSCKTTLGVESGASVFDFTGEIETQVNAYQALHPKDTFREVQKKYLAHHESKHYLNQISPRCFEAIALKTALVLYEGEYSGILKPDRHYISLKKDYSNINEVLEQIKDTRYLQKMVDAAYEEIALNSNYSYKYFIGMLDKIMSNSFQELDIEKVLLTYNAEDFQRIVRDKPFKKRLFEKCLKIYKKSPAFLQFIIKLIWKGMHQIRQKWESTRILYGCQQKLLKNAIAIYIMLPGFVQNIVKYTWKYMLYCRNKFRSLYT